MIIKIGFINEMNVPILAKMPAHGHSFEKVFFLAHSKHDCSFENLFKILIFSIEMNVPILAKMSAHGRSFEKVCFLSHSKYDCSSVYRNREISWCFTILMKHKCDFLIVYFSTSKKINIYISHINSWKNVVFFWLILTFSILMWKFDVICFMQ